MFEDLKNKPTEQDIIKNLEKVNKEAKGLLRESRDVILDLQNENHILERKYNQSYNDARRFVKVIQDETTPERFDEIKKEQEELEKILQDANLTDDDI